MLNQPTLDKLCAMRMRGMAEALQRQMQEPDIHQGENARKTVER